MDNPKSVFTFNMSAKHPLIPTQIELTDKGVKLLWSEGKQTLLPYRQLRLDCRCARCVEELTGRRRLNPSTVPEDVIAVDYLVIGKYALQFLWSDGHETGIYPYSQLRALLD